MKSFEVNVRAVYATRTYGLGHTALEKICCMMNMPRPMTVSNFSYTSNNLRDRTKILAEKSMKKAAVEAKKHIGGIGDIGVSVDGTWQRRGYTSMNGVVIAISIDMGKIIDLEILTWYCRLCDLQRKKLKDNVEALNAWMENHKEHCKINHVGSAPSMEAAGAKVIFERSVDARGVRYTKYYGDGDSKGYAVVRNIYPDVEVKKFECIGHYQKWVGTRLLRLKKNSKGMKELTHPVINKLQNYFGIALRANTTTVEAMSKAIFSSFMHVASSKENDFHWGCDSSWCQKKKDDVDKTNLYQPGKGLSMPVVHMIRPIYNDLCNPKELSKCLHGKTKNQNESYNSMIWERAPKITYCGRDKLELAVFDATLNFNDGRQASIEIIEAMGITPGHYMTTMCNRFNKSRIRNATNKARECVKKSRKIMCTTKN